MATNYPDVIPMIAYEDGLKAMDWLSSAFGFKERTRMLGKDGRLSHGEMQAGHGVIMLATPTPDYQASRRHREAYVERILGREVARPQSQELFDRIAQASQGGPQRAGGRADQASAGRQGNLLRTVVVDAARALGPSRVENSRR